MKALFQVIRSSFDNKKSIALVTGILFLGLFLPQLSFAGGPWILKKKTGLVQAYTTVNAYSYDRLLSGFGRETVGINRETFHIDYGIYAEYGLSNKFNILANIPFKFATTGAQSDSLYNPVLLDEGSINGLSNLWFALKYGIIDKDIKVSVSAQTRLNTGAAQLDKGLATGFLSNSFGLFAHVGGGINEHWYAFGEAGYWINSNDYSDIIEGQIEAGRSVGKSKRFTIAGTANLRFSMRNGNFDDSTLLQTGLYTDDQEWVAISVKANYQTPTDWGVGFGAPLVPIYFNHVGFVGAFSLSVYKKF